MKGGRLHRDDFLQICKAMLFCSQRIELFKHAFKAGGKFIVNKRMHKQLAVQVKQIVKLQDI